MPQKYLQELQTSVVTIAQLYSTSQQPYSSYLPVYTHCQHKVNDLEPRQLNRFNVPGQIPRKTGDLPLQSWKIREIKSLRFQNFHRL